MGTTIGILYQENDSLILSRIMKARHDINNSLSISFNPEYCSEIRTEHRKHVEVMRDYIEDLEFQRRDLREEYRQDFRRIYGKVPF